MDKGKKGEAFTSKDPNGILINAVIINQGDTIYLWMHTLVKLVKLYIRHTLNRLASKSDWELQHNTSMQAKLLSKSG